jgi:hypothetical protein
MIRPSYGGSQEKGWGMAAARGWGMGGIGKGLARFGTAKYLGMRKGKEVVQNFDALSDT